MSKDTIEPVVINPFNADLPSLQRWLVGRIARYLETQPQNILVETPLAEIGLDSVYALSLCGDIEDTLHLVVEPTLAWDYPTIAAIAQHLYDRLAVMREFGRTESAQ